MAPSEQNYVSVHALSSGFLTLPEHMFVTPSSPENRNTVPSLSFLVQHTSPVTSVTTRVVFDLGLRKNLKKYPEALQKHLYTRRPLTTDPDVKDSLEAGGMNAEDIDVVMLSHVHWDHVGTPRDFWGGWFVVGNGSLGLLKKGGSQEDMGSHAFYENDLLPLERTKELPEPGEKGSGIVLGKGKGGFLENLEWKPLGSIPNTIDVFSDGSLYIVDSPGHLEGHINLLARIGKGKWLYLAGDACHDRRLMSKKKEIATWKNEKGDVCCIHVDREKTKKTIEMINGLESEGLLGDHVEVVLAHDVDWLNEEKNKARFWPGKL